MSGKGSSPRPYSVDQKTFSDNWEQIFGKKTPRELDDAKAEDEEFEIQSDENSFGRFLGYTEDYYNGSTKYISEMPSPLSQKEIYLYFTNISTKPFCKINADNKITYLHKIIKPINELDCLIVQFKDTNTEEETNFHNFNGKYFSLELNMNCDKNWNIYIFIIYTMITL